MTATDKKKRILKYFKTKPKTNSKVRLRILTPKIQLQVQTPDSIPRLHSILYTMPVHAHKGFL